MGNVNRLRILLLCHVSTEELRNMLPLRKRFLEKIVMSRFFSRNVEYGDYAMWNKAIISELSKRDDVELVVVSPHPGLKQDVCSFEQNGVSYYFYKSDNAFPFNYVNRLLKISQLFDYRHNRRIVKNIIKKVNPSMVNLVGAENPYYSLCALDVEDIPVFLHCQTVYANPNREVLTGKLDRYRWNSELRVFSKIDYYACSGTMYYDLIKKYKKTAVVFPIVWPKFQIQMVKCVNKRYDFVFFARFLNKNKGFDSAIEALALVKKEFPLVRLLAIGTFDKNKVQYLNRIEELGLTPNIEIHPSFARQIDMLNDACQARYAVLPITMDVVSGTIYESMRMGLPVVTNITSGTPRLNRTRQTVLLSPIGDNVSLAQNMLSILKDKNLADVLRENAFKLLEEIDSDSRRNVDKMIAQYKAVMAHFYKGIPINQELLFNK